VQKHFSIRPTFKYYSSALSETNVYGCGSQTFCCCRPLSLHPKLLRTLSLCQRCFDY